MDIARMITTFLGVKRAIREMEQSPNPQAFRGEPRPRPQGGKQSNRQRIDRMLSAMEVVPLPDSPTEVDIARHLGVSVQQLREVMQGQTVDQLATRYGVTAYELADLLGTMLQQQSSPPKSGDPLPVKAALAKLKSYGYRPLAAAVKDRAKRQDLKRSTAKAYADMVAKARKLRGC